MYFLAQMLPTAGRRSILLLGPHSPPLCSPGPRLHQGTSPPQPRTSRALRPATSLHQNQPGPGSRPSCRSLVSRAVWSSAQDFDFAAAIQQRGDQYEEHKLCQGILYTGHIGVTARESFTFNSVVFFIIVKKEKCELKCII